MEEVNDCPIHGSPNTTCGGPHDEVFTDLGWEVGLLGFDPVGVRIPITPEAEERRYSDLYRRIYGQQAEGPAQGEGAED